MNIWAHLSRLIVALLLCGLAACEDAQETPQVVPVRDRTDAAEGKLIVTLMSELASWTDKENLNEDEIQAYQRVSQRMQMVTPAIFLRFISEGKTKQSLSETLKVFLVLKFMFDLPTSESLPSGRVAYGFGINFDVINGSWPVEFIHGGVIKVSAYPGWEGRFMAIDEYYLTLLSSRKYRSIITR